MGVLAAGTLGLRMQIPLATVQLRELSVTGFNTHGFHSWSLSIDVRRCVSRHAIIQFDPHALDCHITANIYSLAHVKINVLDMLHIGCTSRALQKAMRVESDAQSCAVAT